MSRMQPKLIVPTDRSIVSAAIGVNTYKYFGFIYHEKILIMVKCAGKNYGFIDLLDPTEEIYFTDSNKENCLSCVAQMTGVILIGASSLTDLLRALNVKEEI